ncbi:MAG: hypothetical protein AVDCRST_MAG68-2024 [uncultured Gemmatimonadetes bacterium]|uniref:Teneurin-like YD-shell domain-containing protein n=1 Tax=uncultured Gemmatimonadota bacterium TaxID=203437 RepID=A0A6J4L7R1_9BACT|nr:MAG: hypothetical protein AVDCRST_MAG68-2024 [uncultured Gemmatimonadota bacterium]
MSGGLIRRPNWFVVSKLAAGTREEAVVPIGGAEGAYRVEAIDPRGHITRVAVDPFGQPTRVEEPLGRLTSITRDRHGRVTRTVGPSGHTARAEYVGVELRTQKDETTGALVQMEYEDRYHQLTRASGTGTTEVVNTYDPADPQRKLLKSRTGPPGAPETHYTFDGRGRVLTATDPKGHGTTYTYGGPGNTYDNLRTVSQGPRSATIEYDRFGRDSLNISPSNDISRTEYDLLNRVTRKIDPEGGATVYRYSNGQLYQVTDPKLQTYSFHRDMLGRLGSEVDPRGQWSYTYYDRAGNPTYTKNRRGQVVTAGYNELSQRVWRDADGARTTWSHDPKGLWTEAGNAESTNRIEFDVAGQARKAITTMGGVTYTQVITPDAQGRRKQMDLTAPWGSRMLGYTYNARGHLETLRDLSGGTTTLAYNDDGQEESHTLPTGLVVGRGYPSTHVTASIAYSVPAVEDGVGRGYHQNANGLVDASRMAHYNPIYADQERVRRYTYDRRGWLGSFTDEVYRPEQTGSCADPTAAMDPDGGVCVPGSTETTMLAGGKTYTYDAVGNRTDPARGMTVENGNRLTGIDGYTLSYDADGNLTSKLKPGVDDVQPSWNSLGQMTGAWRHERGIVWYGYDAFGRRVRRTAPDGSVTRYLYDGDDLLMELDGAGNPIREYTHFPGVDRPHSVRSWPNGGATYYYATDNPGHVVGLIDGANQMAAEYHYSPWGEPESVRGNVVQPLRFMAREYEEHSGLYQVRARWYDAQQGRFVSEDPIGLAGGINPYRYAGNDPINKIDPSGMCEEWHTIETTIYPDGTEVDVVVRIYWKGDDCFGGGGGGGGGGPNAPTAQQFQYIECIATQWLRSGWTILSRLHSGRIFVTDHIPSNQNKNAAMWTVVGNPSQPIVIYGGAYGTNGGAFKHPPAEFAYFLGHEARHVAQSDGTLMPRSEFLHRYASDGNFRNVLIENDASHAGRAAVRPGKLAASCSL